MANEMFTQLPTTPNAQLTDIICAVQGFVSPSNLGTSVQESLQQVFNLMLANIILHNAGNPNGSVAGNVYQLCWDTTNSVMYVCTTSGTSSTAVWTALPPNSGITTPAHGGTGVASPTAHTIPIAEGASNFNFLSLTNGQLLIGSTGADPVPATLTAGAGISIVNGAGSISISGTASSIGWNVVTTNQSMAVENGYIANAGGALVFTLPATAAVGTAIACINLNTGGFSIAQNAGQNIQIGSRSTTVGAGGSLASTAQGDSIYLVCAVANTTFITVGGVQGAFTVV